MAKIWHETETFQYGGAKLLVLLKMADHADDHGGHIFPSIASIATACRMSNRGVQKALRELTADGWIESVKFGGGGRGHATEYRIVLERFEKGKGEQGSSLMAQKKGEQRAPFIEKDEKSSPFESVKGELCSKKGEHSSPQPSLTNPNRADVPARAHDSQTPATVSDWGSWVAQAYGYALAEVMTIGATAMFRDWCAQGLSTDLVADAINAAHIKNGGRPGHPTYYRNFVRELAAETRAASRARTHADSSKQEQCDERPARSDRPGVAGFYEHFGRRRAGHGRS